MPWKMMDVREQRVKFAVAASRHEKPFSHLCQEFGVSRPTGYVWAGRYQDSGVDGVKERSRRPLHSPQQTDAWLEQAVIEVRERYPDWGARKLRIVLRREGIELTHSTIHRILLRRGLVRDEDRHSPVQRFERGAPNELWQMDFKGPKLWPQRVGPLSVIDDHSRYAIVLQAVGSTHGESVREQLESAFASCGLPEEMLMDHGVPWWSTLSRQGTTQLSLWLMKQGIRLHWSRIRHPQTQGKVERFHGALQRALERRGAPEQDVQTWLDEYRWEHNHVRPHEALAMRTPAELWRPSPRSYDPDPPRWEYPEGARVVKVDSWGKLHLKGKTCNISKALCGERVQIKELEGRVQIYYCNTLIREIDLDDQRSAIAERWSSAEIPQP
jgi:transposase InsO family protein